MEKNITQEQALSVLHDRESEAIELLKNEKETSAVLDKAKNCSLKSRNSP